MIRLYTRPIALVAAAAFIVFHTVMIAALFDALSSPRAAENAYTSAATPSAAAPSFLWSEAKHTPTHDRKPVLSPVICVEPVEPPKIHFLFCYFPDTPVLRTSPESTPSSQRDPPALSRRS